MLQLETCRAYRNYTTKDEPTSRVQRSVDGAQPKRPINGLEHLLTSYYPRAEMEESLRTSGVGFVGWLSMDKDLPKSGLFRFGTLYLSNVEIYLDTDQKPLTANSQESEVQKPFHLGFKTLLCITGLFRYRST